MESIDTDADEVRAACVRVCVYATRYVSFVYLIRARARTNTHKHMSMPMHH